MRIPHWSKAVLVSVPTKWPGNFWIILLGMVGLILQANVLIQYTSGIVGPVGCKVRWREVCMVNETLDMVGGCILVNVCLEIRFIQ